MSGIVIHRSRHTQQYVIVSNAVARDTRLSLQAHGLLVFLLSLPPDKSITTDEIAELFPNSRDSVRKAMRELRETRYVVLHTERAGRGRIRKWIEVFDAPQDAPPGAAAEPPGNSAPSQVSASQAAETQPRLVPPAETEFAQVGPGAGIPAAGNTADNYRSTGRSTQTRSTAASRDHMSDRGAASRVPPPARPPRDPVVDKAMRELDVQDRIEQELGDVSADEASVIQNRVEHGDAVPAIVNHILAMRRSAELDPWYFAHADWPDDAAAYRLRLSVEQVQRDRRRLGLPIHDEPPF